MTWWQTVSRIVLSAAKAPFTLLIWSRNLIFAPARRLTMSSSKQSPSKTVKTSRNQSERASPNQPAHQSRVDLRGVKSEGFNQLLKTADWPLDERRKRYHCGNRYITKEKLQQEYLWSRHCPSPNDFSDRICVYQGDITELEVDAIVNAANTFLRGGGGVDGAIHRAAGRGLSKECREEHSAGCPTGEAVITDGYLLPARWVIHTAGPIGDYPDKLRSSYERCFERMLETKSKSIAFCCISTGIYGFPNEKAAKIAVEVTNEYLSKYSKDEIELIVFCCFLSKDVDFYKKALREVTMSEVSDREISDKQKKANRSPVDKEEADSDVMDEKMSGVSRNVESTKLEVTTNTETTIVEGQRDHAHSHYVVEDSDRETRDIHKKAEKSPVDKEEANSDVVDEKMSGENSNGANRRLERTNVKVISEQF